MENFVTRKAMLAFLIVLSLGQFISASLFLPRQAGINVPPACTSNCSELNTILQSCSDTSCLCTQLLLDDLASCSICVGQLSGSNFDSPQQTLNNLVEECEEAGVTLSPVLLPGEPTSDLPVIPPSTPQNGPNAAGEPTPSPTTDASPTPSSVTTTTTSSSSQPPSSLNSPAAAQSTPTTAATQPAQTPNAPDTPTSPPPASPDTSGSSRIKTTIHAGLMVFCTGIILALS